MWPVPAWSRSRSTEAREKNSTFAADVPWMPTGGLITAWLTAPMWRMLSNSIAYVQFAGRFVHQVPQFSASEMSALRLRGLVRSPR